MPELVSEDEVPDEGVLPLAPAVPDELSLDGVSVVVVVVVLEPEPPDVPDVPLPDDWPVSEVAEPDFVGSVVVVVVVVCPNVIAAVPISDRKMAIGNFFMLAPCP